MNKIKICSLFLVLVLQSCVSKKKVLYFQDAKNNQVEEIVYESLKIQPNDILSIVVGAAVPETVIPYNVAVNPNTNLNLDVLKLQGYLVGNDGTIDFPTLGKIMASGLSIEELEHNIRELLAKGEHLIEPTINIRLLNAKVTVLGEVKSPGTFTFTEQNISLPQALGYAGDLTINGKRKDVLIIREEKGGRRMEYIDLTSTDWFNNSVYYVKPNDVIIVNPNSAKVKSAGFIGNAGTVLTIVSLILTSIVLITR